MMFKASHVLNASPSTVLLYSTTAQSVEYQYIITAMDEQIKSLLNIMTTDIEHKCNELSVTAVFILEMKISFCFTGI